MILCRSLVLSLIVAFALSGGCATTGTGGRYHLDDIEVRRPVNAVEAQTIFARHSQNCLEQEWQQCLVESLAAFKMPTFVDQAGEEVSMMEKVLDVSYIRTPNGPTTLNQAWFKGLVRQVAQASGGVVTLRRVDPEVFGIRVMGTAEYLELVHRDGRRFRFTYGPYGQPINFGWRANKWMLPPLE